MSGRVSFLPFSNHVADDVDMNADFLCVFSAVNE